MSATLRKPRVLLVGPTPPPMGGIVRYCQDILASDLAREFHLEFFSASIPYELRPKAWTGTRQSIFTRDGVPSAVRQIAWAGNRARELNALMKRRRPHVVHIPTCTGLGFWRNALHVVCAKRQGCRVLWHLLGAIDDFWREGSPVRRYAIRRFLDRADVHVVQSDGLRDVTSGFTSRPVLSIYNGVRTEELRAPDGYAHSDPAEGKVRIIDVGTLGHRKGTFDLIEMAKRLRTELANLEFVLVGGGEVEHFRRLVAEAGLSDCVRIPGVVDDAEKTRLLQSSDVFALPSYAEGQPIALLEAMAVGLPIISSTVGSIPEVVKDANGRILTPGDLAALEGYLRELAASAALREQIGRHNADEAERKYSVGRTMEQLGQVYRCLVEGTPPRLG